MFEHNFQCPHCWTTISMLLDPSVSTTYVEDCEVCCNPLQISAQFESQALVGFDASSIEQ